MRRSLTVLRTSPQVLIQDLGRPGNAHLGVPPSGALDQPALRLANRLVGNPEHAAGLELLLGGLALRAGCSCTVAVTGPGVAVSVNEALVGSHVPLHLGAGDELRVDSPSSGLRCYLAVSGGIDVPAEMGSRATDVLSGIGPAPVQRGDVLPLGEPMGVPEGADELAPPAMPAELAIPLLLGPRDDWFDHPAARLSAGRWTVSTASNRVGLRLEGSPLRRKSDQDSVELPSEGILTGAVQVPPGGEPVIFLADHPTTGGYPVIAIVRSDALPLLGQARPGTGVRFRVVN